MSTRIRLFTSTSVGKVVCEQDGSAQVAGHSVLGPLSIVVQLRQVRVSAEDPVDVKIRLKVTNWEEQKVIMDRLTKVQLQFGIPGGESWALWLPYASVCEGKLLGECSYVHTASDESSFYCFPWVDLWLCLPAPDNSALFKTLDNGHWHVLYPEIDEAPDFETNPGSRFTLRSNEVSNKGRCFYVHASVLAERCPVLQTWLQENRGGLREGEPLMIDCSTQTLSTLLALLYAQVPPSHPEIHPRLTVLVHEVLRVAQVWQMPAVVDFCVGYIRNNYCEHFGCFNLLARWFVAVSMYAGNGLGDEQLELLLLNRLYRLAHDKQERLASVVQEYEDMNGKDRLLALLKLRD